MPDANYIDWRYTNSMVGPWTELNFHYGNDRVKATVQIASYNVTDSGTGGWSRTWGSTRRSCR